MRTLKAEQRKANKESWKAALTKISSIVVFDTETSGLQAGRNVILSLSWQVLDNKLRKIQERTRFFEWPEDEDRVEDGAIEVNGLTKERLAELGTSDKAEALQEFADAIADADLLVAHNGSFDKSFVLVEAKREGININMSIPLWDTMHRMTDYCALPGYYGDYKWPKLIELANSIRVKTDDIDWHQSAADVEVTARCLRAIVRRGLMSFNLYFFWGRMLNIA